MPVVRVTKRLRFSAAHRLFSPALGEAGSRAAYGKCANPGGHGHDYVLDVTVEGEVDPATGMVVNVAALKRAAHERVVAHVDHRFLDRDVPLLAGVVPTMENLVVEFWRALEGAAAPARLARVRLYETEENWAEFEGEGLAARGGEGDPRDEGREAL